VCCLRFIKASDGGSDVEFGPSTEITMPAVVGDAAVTVDTRTRAQSEKAIAVLDVMQNSRLPQACTEVSISLSISL
jgi:hypothetical protein